MKKFFLAGLVALPIILGGCMVKEYVIGSKVDVAGMLVTLRAQVWEVAESGIIDRPLHWEIRWGDGTISTEAEANGISYSSALEWEHRYARPGQYTISISVAGAMKTISVLVPNI